MNEGNHCLQVSNLGSPWDSPFEIHRDIILDDYGTAAQVVPDRVELVERLHAPGRTA
jgi:hypothetical protein